MKLHQNFQFSQSNLQDFVDCRRRFQLKHLFRLSWPAIETEPVAESERLIDLGSRFHHLVHQFCLGIPPDKLSAQIHDENLTYWWEQFQLAISEKGSLCKVWSPSAKRYPEITISSVLGDSRLIAKMDLVTLHPDGSLQIVDWKTSQQVPRHSWLSERLQTKVYPYLIHQAGSFLTNQQPIKPEQIEMIYWYPSLPESLISFPYDQRQYQSDHAYLHTIVDTLVHLKEEPFTMTNDDRLCRFCVYRSLCNRGTVAGQITDYELLSIEEDENFEFDFNQIDQIAY